MGYFIEKQWHGNAAAPIPRERRSGLYRVFIPDKLARLPIVLGSEISNKAAVLESKIRKFSASSNAIGIEAIARLLVRSEAVASSYLEGLQVSSKKVAQMQIYQELSGKGKMGYDAASQVVANIDLIDKAVAELSLKPILTVADLEKLQWELISADFGKNKEIIGIRKFQNWVGGSSYHPLEAEYIPPPPELVVDLLQDLVDYASGATHGALVQSALVHAQFETIHPFGDGNGRIGRALIHTIWRSRGLEPTATLPVSAALATRSQLYVQGLTAFRTVSEIGSPLWQAALTEWLRVFFDATEAALNIAEKFSQDVAALSQKWRQNHEKYVRAASKRALRSDSTAVRLREGIPAFPIFTTKQVANRLQVSLAAAKNACVLLHKLGVIEPLSIGKGIRGWYAPEIFQVLNIYERAIASSQWDTELRLPERAIPSKANATA